MVVLFVVVVGRRSRAAAAIVHTTGHTFDWLSRLQGRTEGSLSLRLLVLRSKRAPFLAGIHVVVNAARVACRVREEGAQPRLRAGELEPGTLGGTLLNTCPPETGYQP